MFADGSNFLDLRSEAAKQAERERIDAEERGERPMTLFGIPVIVNGKPITRPKFAKLNEKRTWTSQKRME